MDNRNYFTMAIPALLLGVAYLQPINAAPAEDLPNVTGRMTITQQTFTVSGVVTDTNGEPIIGANVIERDYKWSRNRFWRQIFSLAAKQAKHIGRYLYRL